MYGFISTIGEPSKASKPLTVKVQFSLLTSSTTQKPTGFGLDGLLQAKTPVSTLTACFLGKNQQRPPIRLIIA